MGTAKYILYTFCFLFIFSPAAISNTIDEINYLLNYVEQTNCQYDRNGTLHNGAEAREHIEKKYAYFKKKINTTEDFIAYSATKSTISGKKYKIHCPDKQTIDSDQWLLKVLNNYRHTK